MAQYNTQVASIPKVSGSNLGSNQGCRFAVEVADRNTGQAIDVRPPLCGSIVVGGFGGLPLPFGVTSFG